MAQNASTETNASLKDRYGPWAVIAGASEGTGRAFSRQLAAAGINCVLIARRPGPLQALAETLHDECGVECITAAVDLSSPDAFERIRETVGEREVGLFVSNAGADPNGSHFLDLAVDRWIELVNRNVYNTLRCCHHFGGAMRERGKGGLLLVGSGSCYGGGAFMSVYSASKAFDLCFAESLWAELKPFGVDVLYLVLSTTDTPALRELLAEKGMPVPDGLAAPEEVVKLGLARLPYGPVVNWGSADDEPGFAPQSPAARRARVEAIGEAAKRIFGERRG